MRRSAWSIIVSIALALAVLPTIGGAQAVDKRIGESDDPTTAAIQISSTTFEDGGADRVVIGRLGVFADTLVASALAGRSGPVLFVPGGDDIALPAGVAEEITRVLADDACTEGRGALLVGGEAALSAELMQTVEDLVGCAERISGPSRVETAASIARTTGLSEDGQVMVATAADWPDAGAAAAYAAYTGTPIVLTFPDSLHPATDELLRELAPTDIAIIGGVDALSAEVEAALADIAPVRRVAGPARDHTALAILTDLWQSEDAQGQPIQSVILTGGYRDDAWVWLYALAPYAARTSQPILYADDDGATPITAQYLADNPDLGIVQAGSVALSGPDAGRAPGQPGPTEPPTAPPTPTPTPDPDECPDHTPSEVPAGTRPTPTLCDADVALETVTTAAQPLDLTFRPDSDQVWIAEREGGVQVWDGTALTTAIEPGALDVDAEGEGGLLGLDFSADGRTLFLSYTVDGPATDMPLTSVLQQFTVTADGTVDLDSGADLLRVDQPASNHDGGDVVFNADGDLLWSLGDGGGGNDTYGNGQDPDTILGGIVRITPDGQGGYTIPAGNTLATPELWVYGLRNPFRMTTDPYTGELWVADVGQSAWEEVDLLSPDDAGANLGWPVYEGPLFRPSYGDEIPARVDPVYAYEQTPDTTACSITGGAVYAGEQVPALQGAYIYADFCAGDVTAVSIAGAEPQARDLGVDVASPTSLNVAPDGQIWITSVGGDILRLVAAP